VSAVDPGLEAVLDAGDHNLAAVLRRSAAASPDGVLDDDGRLVLVSVVRSWPGPYHNGALRLDRSLPPDEVLERAQSFFQGKSDGYGVWIGHADDDLQIAAVAAGLPLLSPTGVPRMVLDHRLAPLPVPPDVSLDEVVDEAGRQAFLDVTIKAYADSFLPAEAASAQLATVDAVHGPDVRSVLARVDGRPVAAAMIVAGGGVASVQMVGTLPDARGRGLGELCTNWTVQAGFDFGAPAVVLEASEMGEPIYRRMGFVVASRYRWCFGPPPSSG
jgi:GNAT superfamily N-acetyltransferase